MRPERVNKWPNSMTDIWWWWWSRVIGIPNFNYFCLSIFASKLALLKTIIRWHNHVVLALINSSTTRNLFGSKQKTLLETNGISACCTYWGECPYVFTYHIYVSVCSCMTTGRKKQQMSCKVKLFRKNMATTKLVSVTLNCEGLFFYIDFVKL